MTTRLLRGADVAILDAGWKEQAVLGRESVAETNPGLVTCVISEFGDRGPWAGRAPYGELPAQLAGEATASLGRPGEAPVRVGNDVAGMYAAIYAVQAICAALLERERSGLGQRIDVSLFGSVLAMRSTLWVALSNPDSWSGYHLDSYVKPPDQGHQCKAGAILFPLARVTPEGREALTRDLEMEWVKDDPRYDDFLRDRGGPTSDVSEIVHPIWERAFSKFTADEVIEGVRRHGGWAFPTNDYQQLVDLDQVRHVGMVRRSRGQEVLRFRPCCRRGSSPRRRPNSVAPRRRSVSTRARSSTNSAMACRRPRRCWAGVSRSADPTDRERDRSRSRERSPVMRAPPVTGERRAGVMMTMRARTRAVCPPERSQSSTVPTGRVVAGHSGRQRAGNREAGLRC